MRIFLSQSVNWTQKCTFHILTHMNGMILRVFSNTFFVVMMVMVNMIFIFLKQSKKCLLLYCMEQGTCNFYVNQCDHAQT